MFQSLISFHLALILYENVLKTTYSFSLNLQRLHTILKIK